MKAAVQSELPMLKGERLASLPDDLFIPPDALELFLEDFSGPMDVLLYLIRKKDINILLNRVRASEKKQKLNTIIIFSLIGFFRDEIFLILAKPCVGSFNGEQLFVLSLLDNFALLEKDDLVRLPNRAEAVGDD